MQYDLNNAVYNNQSDFADDQYPPMNPPSYETDVCQSYPGAPPCAQYSQQSISNTDYTVSSAQHNGHVLLHPQKSVLAVSPRHALATTVILTKITLKLKVFFIFSGIAYLLWGTLAIALEISILLYSYATYYRGIYSGLAMLSISISMLIIACRVSDSMISMVRLLYFVVVFCTIAVMLAIADVTLLKKCINHISEDLCDAPIAYKLKMIILIELCIATIYTGINLAIVRYVQKKSRSIPPVANTLDHQY
ncbi:unnamed protein product [Rotaria sp. Silwood2]|nr:unnamed protein product [Rotaria sp. Silwood2]CAF2535261.1 unnamed protein product [Rotaria sp. Silwood2]CAF2787526.1 unnamed protein product [Rotaria sp. Silwood2]CAF3954224.1 unnamed protein product [Rotaria sp. Silwood2]CAF4002446.1 unnamed protein product [Rotaria sp. Silwood2]